MYVWKEETKEEQVDITLFYRNVRRVRVNMLDPCNKTLEKAKKKCEN